MKHKFITFEGIEGSGKSTQSKMLYEFLVAKNYDAIITREPGGVAAAELIRGILLDESIAKLEAKSEIFLNFAARIEHVEKLIKPALSEGKFVISDRFFDSTIAYQGFGFGADLDIIEKAQELAIGNFAPDITFLIDVPVETSFARIEGRSTNNRYEKFGKDFHQKTRDGFLKIAQNNPRIVIIDGSQPIAEIAKKVLENLIF